MNWLEKQVRPEIWALKPYSSARSEFSAASGMIGLDANENPYRPYPQSAEMDGVNRYPEPQPQRLVAFLAALYKVRVEQLWVGRGMDEGIDLLIRVFCIPYQDNIITTPPTFAYYKTAATIAGVETRELTLGSAPEFTLSTSELIKLCDKNTKIVFLCTPNNPTGSELTHAAIAELARSLPHTIIAVDEAYLEFSELASAQMLMEQYSNLVVMKTLSKAYAGAGLRVGSILAQTPIIQLLAKVMAPYPLPEPCIRLALQVLSPLGLNLAQQRIKLIKEERERVYNSLNSIPGITVYRSAANFLLIKVADATKTYQELCAHGIIVRNRSAEIPDTLRITIGTPVENNLLLAALGVPQGVVKVPRSATLIRTTRETKIIVQVNLDQSTAGVIKSGVGFLDHMLEQLAKHGGFGLQLMAEGDTHIDFHHSVEDVAITLGQAIKQALGAKYGIQRYGFVLPMDESRAAVSLDLSGRGVLVYQANYSTPLIGNFPVELLEHFFLSFAEHLGAAIHLQVDGVNAHHMAEASFKALALALSQAITQGGSNQVPSTKGSL